jgi:glycerol-3-phosphate dehydrogenase (NAD(P)+)
MEQQQALAVLGGGSWGTALVKILSEHCGKPNSNISKLTWWVRSEETAQHIREHHHNPNYISSVEIHPERVNVTSDLFSAISSAHIVVLAVPSAFIAETLSPCAAGLFQNKIIVSAIKGLVPQTRQIVADYMVQTFGVQSSQMIVISGPCHAEEVASEKLSYLTIAGENQQASMAFANMLQGRFIRTIDSRDITGTEYGAVLKNIYAVASGICNGIGLGDNFQAVLISNAIREMEAFLYAVHAHPREITHSAYLGDLLVTAYSQHSRNRTFGLMIGKGYTVKAAQLEMNMIAEGYYATKTMYELNQEHLHVDMPIAEMVYKIIYKNQPAKAEVTALCKKLI